MTALIQTQGVLDQLADFVNGIISAFKNAITAVWNAITGFFNSVVNFLMAVWNKIVGPVIGAVTEAVKSVVTLVLNQIVNTVIQPMVNGQTTSLSTLFGGVSVDTIASYGPSVFANITTTINSESSQLTSVGSTMGSMMSSLSVFSGADTILGPLISMAGPGIMMTVVSMIASVVMSSLLTPLFSQFNTTVLSNDLDTLMAPLGGTSTGALALLDNIAGLTSVTSQPGVTSQDSDNITLMAIQTLHTLLDFEKSYFRLEFFNYYLSSLSVFSGVGTILGPLISMAGPGIMVTVMSMIASVVMSTVLTPLFSQFNSTVLQNDLNTLMAPLGGIATGCSAILNDIAALTSVTSQPDVISQDSGSEHLTQSTETMYRLNLFSAM